jgi:hypothetical protein
MNRNKKGPAAPKAALSNQMLQRMNALEKALQKSRSPNRSRGASAGGLDLNNQSSRSSGRLGLSSSNSSKVRRSHLIDEDEYIADIAGSVGFATTAYPINPGQASTFPWGSKISALYEKYDFQMLEFYYRREVSEYATNGQAGKLMLSVDYDAADSSPTTKQQVLDTEPHVDGMPCTEQIVLRVDCAQMRKQDSHYVRPGSQPANTDIKTYDAGNLFVSTYGNANTTVVGELRVRYKCLLSVPVLESASGGSGSAGSYFQITSALIGEAAAATTIYQPLYATATVPVILANGIGATVSSAGLITLLAGTYLVESNAISYSSTSTPTAQTSGLYQGVAAGVDPVLAPSYGSVAYEFGTAGASGYSNRVSYTYPSIWDTSQMGTTICQQVAVTYGSGSCLNQGYLKITQL